jgi:hypothetical protein
MVTRDEVLEHLGSLPIRDFVAVVQAACEQRREETHLPDGDFEITAFSLAESTFGRFRGEDDAEPLVYLCATVHPRSEFVDWNALGQSGRCDNCRALLTSVAKVAVCPICHEEAGLT